jgi:NDP-sugar pyrophosphorylase family protein
MSDALLPAAILAGGLATRLRPVTEKLPKSLVDVLGEPFIAHQLRLLRAAGIGRVVISLGYLGEMVRDFVGDGSRFGLTAQYVFDGDRLLGTGGALKNALPLLGEAFFVVYGDSYLPCDYRQAQERFLQSGRQALMTVFCNEGKWDTSNVEFAQGTLVAYDKKHRTPRMRHIDYGLGVFRASAFDLVPAGEPYDLADLYQALLAQGQVEGLEVFERFYEVGSFAGIKELCGYLRRS